MKGRRMLTSDSYLSLHANYTSKGGHILHDGSSNMSHLVTQTDAYKILKDGTNAEHITQEMQQYIVRLNLHHLHPLVVAWALQPAWP